ncbi:adenine phosphoribosyltransferase [Propionibacterium sp. oral taxon 192 str. F0372]|uniref:adenine phosphoribosyltransferase n=1 Tax=Propionibacterium sp. oral taxon 192 TaxID=671222 RepID=UPI0003534C41|nr:adenine phosphoribosyltransferase [Propionibacterium sp. oral taxon 192]EPH02747.1 adenine phosphoribosyltransferase [Propionibacterium sp. oral taxon 192 str. F0372]
MTVDPRTSLIASKIRNVPDFPKPGVQFKDITPLVGDVEALRTAVELLAEQAPAVDAVVGIESRGFLFGAPLAMALGVGFVPVRKPGKLPGAVIEEAFDLEYGSSVLAMHTDALGQGHRVLLVDDLLATGGTLIAGAKLVTRLGAEIAGVQVVVELADLLGRENLATAGLRNLVSLVTTTD